jgi:hypothetical protein
MERALLMGEQCGPVEDVSEANNDHWNVMAVGDGTYRIVNVNSGLDLEDNGWGTVNGGVVDQWQDQRGRLHKRILAPHAEQRRFLENRERLQRSRSGTMVFRPAMALKLTSGRTTGEATSSGI